MITSHDIEKKRHEVRRAYETYGCGSDEYETLFSELHKLNLEYMDLKYKKNMVLV